MSTHKPPQSAKIESRILENIRSNFPEYPCTLSDLRYPKKEFVFHFYQFVLEELRISPTKLVHVENQVRDLTHSELHTDIRQFLNLSHSLRSIINKIQNNSGPKFGLEDLTDPNPVRNTLFMFNLLNFYCFADSRVSELIDKLDVIGDRKSEMVQLLDKQKKLLTEVNQRAVNKGKRLDYAKEIKIKKAEMEEMGNESKSLDHMFEKRQSELEDIRRHVARTEATIEELKKTLQELEKRQVQSPDVIKNNHQHLEQRLEKTRQQLKEAQDTAREKKRSIKLFESIVRDQDVRLNLLTEIVAEAKTVKESEKVVIDIKSKLQSVNEVTEGLQGQLNVLKNDLVRIEAQLTNLQLQWEKNKSSLKENIRHLNEEKEILENKQSFEMKEIIQEINEIKKEIDALIECNNTLNKQYEKLYAQLNLKEQEFIAGKIAKDERRNGDLNDQCNA